MYFKVKSCKPFLLHFVITSELRLAKRLAAELNLLEKNGLSPDRFPAMKPFIFIRPALVALLLGVCARSTAQAEVQLVEELSIGVKQPLKVRLAKPPRGFVADAELGLLRHRVLKGRVLHTAKQGLRGLFETRGVRTPKGDLLMMFPEGNHYAAGSGKVNDMIAYRSSDNGKSWKGPTIAFLSLIHI